MPELIEVEYYRLAVDPLIGAHVRALEVQPANYLRTDGSGTRTLSHLVGTRLKATSRRGKLMLLHLADSTGAETQLGLRFGMTGRLLVDGSGPIEQLEYSSSRNDPGWDRVRLDFDGTALVIRDQRCLGALEIQPDLDRLGPEVTELDADAWNRILQKRGKSIKGVLLDQSIVCLLYTSPSPRDRTRSRMPSSA